MLADGQHTMQLIAETIGVGRATLYRHLQPAGSATAAASAAAPAPSPAAPLALAVDDAASPAAQQLPQPAALQAPKKTAGRRFRGGADRGVLSPIAGCGCRRPVPSATRRRERVVATLERCARPACRRPSCTLSMAIGFSPSTAIGSPHRRPSFLPAGGHEFSPRPGGRATVVAGAEPGGRGAAGVPGTDAEIGGGSPVLEP